MDRRLPSHDSNSDSKVTWDDGLVGARVRDHQGMVWVITSPNMDYIPEPHIGIIRVFLMVDARYGTFDPIQHPQILVPEFKYFSAIYRRAPPTHSLHAMWTIPHEAAHFRRLEGTIVPSLGLLSDDFLAPISVLVDATSARVESKLTREADPDAQRVLLFCRSMCQARDRLRSFTSTFKDAVLQCAQVQRYWLLCEAFLTYEDCTRCSTSGNPHTPRPVLRNLMGAFTTSPEMTQTLFQAGIPVWFLRRETTLPQSIKILAHSSLQATSGLCTTPIDKNNGTVFYGLAGARHLLATCCPRNLYRDLSHVPVLLASPEVDDAQPSPISQRHFKKLTASKLSSPDDLNAGITATSRDSGHTRRHHPYHNVNTSHIRGRDKFADVHHEWMPPISQSWKTAMQTVADTCRSMPARPSTEIWGYFVPEPSLIVNSTARRERYILNWLRIRPAWLYLLNVDGTRPTQVPPQWWRDILYNLGEGPSTANSTTRNSKRRLLIEGVLEGIFQKDEVITEHTPESSITWFQYRVSTPISSLSPLILWELFELGFRYELLALDRLLVPNVGSELFEVSRDDLIASIFPHQDLYALRSLPTQGRSGLSATLPQCRVNYIEAFRRVVARWPRCPLELRKMEPLALHHGTELIEYVERHVALFYVKTFFEYAGRAPLVPHVCPS